ncbi:glycosyltransferase family 4 protein [Flavobacterium sp.]|uniref:glycosyltransferase family 4 protein n=1 Tax=Flavobacterium sp. TaxID=239 RepID=UPI002FD9C28C
MKTILIAHNYNETSFAAMSYHLAHHLADMGHRVVFMSHNPYFSEPVVVPKEKGEIIVFSWATTQRPTSLKDFVWYAKIHLKYKPDVIVGHFVGSNISVMVSKMLSFGKTKTFEYYHTLTDQILADLKKMSLKQRLLFLRKKLFYSLFCDVIVCPSDLAKKDLETFHGVKKGIVVLNPMMDRFVSKEIPDSNAIVISFLGRLDPSKGVLDLITAYLKYKKQNPNTKIILNIAGKGRQETEISELAKNNDGINYVGGLSYDKIDRYLNKSHFAIIPSKFDNLPTVGLEALMNKTPLLISTKTGLTHYLTDGKDCFIFEPTVDAIASLFKKVEENQDAFAQMSVNARQTFLEKFSVKTYCDTFSKAIL